MFLKELYENIDFDIEITGITTDSRFVKPGFLFVQKAGKKFDGSEFFQEAINKGAVAIVANYFHYHLPVPVITCPDLEKELIYLLNKFYGTIYNQLCLIGVTGTDGKTTITTLTSFLLNHLKPASYIGTNGFYKPSDSEKTLFTTPILSENYRLLKNCYDDQIHYVCMEVSSQGIANNRIKNILYDYAIFSNLSQEHLDTHYTMQNYFNTKFQLFKQLKPHGIAIINKDDSYSKYFRELDNAIFFSIKEPSDYQAVNIRYFSEYILFDLLTENRIFIDLKINRTEEYNIYNILPSIIIALNEGISIDILYKSLQELPVVPGRMEKIDNNKPYDIYIDFAHTPNALQNVLFSLRKKEPNKIILVCGSAGKKDKSKRPLMGQIATRYADFVIFTSEDPRDEKPVDIINEMIKDVTTTNYAIIVDRKKAIDYSIELASDGDIIIITGKGREDFFEDNNIIYQYSDYDYVNAMFFK